MNLISVDKTEKARQFVDSADVAQRTSDVLGSATRGVNRMFQYSEKDMFLKINRSIDILHLFTYSYYATAPQDVKRQKYLAVQYSLVWYCQLRGNISWG